VEDARPHHDVQFSAQMQAGGVLADADARAVEQEVVAAVDQAVAFAEAGTWEPVADLLRFVHSEGARP
jgi:TPP-dependent pyruvate/acetoin dehydrogenase alpha subunit